jgi:hypothetical protein
MVIMSLFSLTGEISVCGCRFGHEHVDGEEHGHNHEVKNHHSTRMHGVMKPQQEPHDFGILAVMKAMLCSTVSELFLYLNSTFFSLK